MSEDDYIERMMDERAEAKNAPVEQYIRIAELVRVLGGTDIINVSGRNNRESFPKACAAMAAGSESNTEANAWNELGLMPRELVHQIAFPFWKREERGAP